MKKVVLMFSITLALASLWGKAPGWGVHTKYRCP